MSLLGQRLKEASLWGIMRVFQARASIFEMSLLHLQTYNEESGVRNCESLLIVPVAEIKPAKLHEERKKDGSC